MRKSVLHLIDVRGESIEPTLHSGDIVLLDTKVTQTAEISQMQQWYRTWHQS